MEGVVIPDVELIMQAPRKHHTDEVTHEQRQYEQLLAVGHFDVMQLLVD